MDVVRRVTFRANKLHKCALYRDLSQDSSDAPDWLREIGLGEDEVLLGMYENEKGDHCKTLVVTTVGLHLYLDGTPLYLPYRDMVSVNLPPIKSAEEKSTVNRVFIHTKDGRVLEVPVTGGYGRTEDCPRLITDGHTGRVRDAYSLWHFVRSAIEIWKTYAIHCARENDARSST